MKIIKYIKRRDWSDVWFEFKWMLRAPWDNLVWFITRLNQARLYFIFGFNDQTWNGYKFEDLIILKLNIIREVVAKDTNYTEESNQRNLKEIDLIIKLLKRSTDYTSPSIDSAWEYVDSKFATSGKGFMTLKHYDPKTGLELSEEEQKKRYAVIHKAYAREEKTREIAFGRAMKILSAKRFSWD